MDRERGAQETWPSTLQGTRPGQREDPSESPPPLPVEPAEPGRRRPVDDHHEAAAGA